MIREILNEVGRRLNPQAKVIEAQECMARLADLHPGGIVFRDCLYSPWSETVEVILNQPPIDTYYV